VAADTHFSLSTINLSGTQEIKTWLPSQYQKKKKKNQEIAQQFSYSMSQKHELLNFFKDAQE
jgi:hypothetical protein